MATASSRRLPQSATDGKKRDWISEIQTDVATRPSSMVLYGPPGIGKSSTAAAIPGCVFLVDHHERGIETLKRSGIVGDVAQLPPIDSWLNVLEAVKALIDGKHDRTALVIDTLGGLEKLLHQHVCERDFRGEWGDKGFSAYMKGYEVALPDWREFLNLLDKLRDERSMSIVCLAHSIVRPFRNPAGEDFDRYQPDMHAKTWALTHKWCDMVLFADYYVETTTDGGRTKGRGGQDRIMHTEYEAAFEAKNRSNLPSEISMGNSGVEAWGNLCKAIQESKGGAK